MCDIIYNSYSFIFFLLCFRFGYAHYTLFFLKLHFKILLNIFTSRFVVRMCFCAHLIGIWLWFSERCESVDFVFVVCFFLLFCHRWIANRNARDIGVESERVRKKEKAIHTHIDWRDICGASRSNGHNHAINMQFFRWTVTFCFSFLNRSIGRIIVNGAHIYRLHSKSSARTSIHKQNIHNKSHATNKIATD